MTEDVVTLTGEIPEYRTLAPTKANFSYSKDPEDEAWYAVSYGEQVASLDESDVVSQLPTPEEGEYTEPDLTIDASAVTADKQAVALRLTGGTAGCNYAIRLGITTKGGDKLFRTVRLAVAVK